MNKYIGISRPLSVVRGKTSNLDAKYGPYDTLNHAIIQLPEAIRKVGLTVGIITIKDEIETINEYWWKEGTSDNHLVKKVWEFKDLSEEEKDELKLYFEDLSPEEKFELKLKFEDLTPSDKLELKGAKGDTGDHLTVRKTYQTEALALADKNPIDATTSLPLTVGQFVSIVDDGEKNGIYRISSIGGDGTMSLELQGKLGDLSDYAKKGGSTKTLKEVDDDLVQLESDVEQLAYVKIKNIADNGNIENALIDPFVKTDAGGGASTLAINNSTPISGNYDVRFTIITPTTWARPTLGGMRLRLQQAANIGDKIYLHFYAKILSGTPHIRSINAGEGAPSTIYNGDVINGRNTRILDVMGLGDSLGLIYFNSPSAWDMQMDNFMYINLTEAFGAGNEPTEEEMNLLLDIAGINYIDDEVIIPAQKVMQWQQQTMTNLGEGIKTGELIGSNAINEDKASFLIPKHPNLFNGNYIENMAIVNPNYEPFSGGVIAIVPIEQGKSYSIKKHEPSDRFRIALHDSMLSTNTDPVELKEILVVGMDYATEYSFTNSTAYEWMVIHLSASLQKPALKVEEGDTPTPLEDVYVFSENIEIPNTDILEPADNNLFNGNYIVGRMLFSTEYGNNSYIGDAAGGRTAIIEVDPITTYTVKKYSESNRFRLALFNSMPASTGDVSVDKSISAVDTLTEFTFTTEIESKYLAVTVSNNNVEVELKIEVGGVATSYDAKKIKDGIIAKPNIGVKDIKRYMLEDSNIINTISSITPIEFIKMPILGKFTQMYSAPPQLDVITQLLHTDIYSEYDSLVNAYPDYVNMQILGTDALANEIRVYNFTPPDVKNRLDDDYTYKSNKLKIAILTGVHGNEKTSVINALNFFKDMCHNHRDDDNLDILKWNVDFSIVPICSPNAFNTHTRLNSNGVNINRNFDANWREEAEAGDFPASEEETQVIQEWMKSLTDVFYLVDFHVIWGDRPMAYIYDIESTTIVNSLFRGLTRKWKKEFPESTDNYKIYGYTTNPVPNGDTTRYARNLGFRAICLETVITYPFGSDAITVNRASMELLANYIIALISNK